jgi:hypothetical protein
MSKWIETGQERLAIAKYASVRILHNSKFIIRYSIFAFSLPPSWGHPEPPALQVECSFIFSRPCGTNNYAALGETLAIPGKPI